MRSISLLLLRISIAVLVIWPLGRSQSLNIIGSCPAAGWAVEVAGNYAYAAADSFGLLVFDISNPANPSIVSSYDTPGWTVDLSLSGAYAYLADYSSLQIVDISNPLMPALTGTYPAAGLLGIHVNGDYAYLAFGYHPPVLGILNISNPASPESTSALIFSGGAFDVYYFNGYLAILSNITEPYSNYLRTVDVTSPQNPLLAGSLRIPGDIEIPKNVIVSGDYAYVGDGSSGLQIVNVHDPVNPVITGSYNTPGIANGVNVSGGYAFVADFNTGVQMIDVHDPANPRFMAGSPTYGYAIGVTTAGDYVYVICMGNFYVMRPEYSVGCVYQVGDINDDSTFNGLDIVFGVNYFKGGDIPPYLCDCDSDFVWFVAGDVNGSCTFNGIDIVYGVNYLKGAGPAPIPCPNCPPDRQGHRHQDIRGDCLERKSVVQDSGYMVLEAVGNDLHIQHNDAFYQCCLIYSVEYQIADPDITAIEHDTGAPCNCICYFNLESILQDLEPDLYTVRLIGIFGDTVGVDTITVGGR